ncbi:MAG: ATP-binding protein [Spirochaetia bacterium]|nr:ATP-binding protein [Spirochaetia bacterium]
MRKSGIFIKINKEPFYLSIFFLIIFVILYNVLGHIERNEKFQVKETLESILKITHDNIKRWKAHRIQNLENIAMEGEVKSITKILLNHNANTITYKSALKEIQLYLKPKINALKDDNFFLISKDFINLASLDTTSVGKKYASIQQYDEIQKIFHGKSVLTPPFESDISKKPEMIIGAPVKNNSNDIIAALIFLVPPENEFTAILQLGRVAKTGETYAFNKEGTLISESRFNAHLLQAGLLKKGERGILNILIDDPGTNLLENSTSHTKDSKTTLTKMAKSAISGNSGFDLEGYRDYRGVTVVGSWLWDNDLDIGITTEVDRDEIYEHSNENFFLIIFLTGSIILLALIYSMRQKNILKNMTVLGEKLEINNEELEKANEELAQYASVVSHDLKTPLRAIHSYSDFLMEDLIDSLQDQHKTYLIGLNRAVKQSETLVNDMLEYHKLGKAKLSISKIDLNNFIEELKSIIKQSSNEEMTIENNIKSLDSDIVLLRQIFYNLISNAFKYNESQPKKISIMFSYYDEHHIQISVADNGIGIEPEYHEKIFGIFQRLHPSDEYDGTGVGLAVVKKAVDKLKGDIKLESKLNEGSKFIIILPVNKYFEDK